MTDKEELTKAFETLRDFCCGRRTDNNQTCGACPLEKSCYRDIPWTLSVYARCALKELEHD